MLAETQRCSISSDRDVKKGERTKKAPLPFTTSTLQQEASKALNFPISEDDADRPAVV